MQANKVKSVPRAMLYSPPKVSTFQVERDLEVLQNRFEQEVKLKLDSFIRGNRASQELQDLRKHYRYCRVDRRREKTNPRATPVTYMRRSPLLLPELTVISLPKTREMQAMSEAGRTHRVSASVDIQMGWKDYRRNNRSEAGVYAAAGVSQGNQTGELQETSAFGQLTL
jgi:hypothetical protein